MKSGAQWVAMRIARAMARKTVVIIALASLAIVTAAMGVWAHNANAAKARIAAAARKQAATLNDVMAKLNQMESEMKGQARALNTKLADLEYQNDKLASYEVRDHAATARLEVAAERMPMYGGQPGPYPPPQIGPPPITLQTQICGQGQLTAQAQLTPFQLSTDAGVHLEGGLDAFGDGAKVQVDPLQVGGNLGLQFAGQAGLQVQSCISLPQFNIFSGDQTVDVQQLLSSIQSGSQALADKLAQTYMQFTQVGNEAITNGLNTLSNLNLSVSPQQILQLVNDPSAAFQNVSNMISSLPLPQGISNFFTDPSSLFPPPTDFSPADLCNNFSGGSGPISSICNIAPSALTDLNGIGQVVSNVTNVQTDLADFKTNLSNVETGVTNFCTSAQNSITGLKNANINIPTLASFQLPDGLSVTNSVTLLGVTIPTGFGLNTHTVSIGPQTINSPFAGIPPLVTCPSF